MKATRMCTRCGSDDLKYDKFYAVCSYCGNLMPKKIFSGNPDKTKPIFTYEPEKIFYDGRMRGVIFGDKYITKRTKIHFVRKYAGFGISKKIFDMIKKRVKKIAIIYTKDDGTQEVYYSDIETWLEFGKVDKLGMNERQIFLPIECMEVSK